MIMACDEELKSIDLNTHETAAKWIASGSVNGVECNPLQQECFVSIAQGSVRLYDGRTGVVASSNVGISQAKWSPFAPYWLATTCIDNESMCIFDIRYSLDKPMRCYKDCVGCFDWSNTNCDLLVGAGVDRSVSLYSLAAISSALQSAPCFATGGPLTCCM